MLVTTVETASLANYDVIGLEWVTASCRMHHIF